MGKKGRVKSPSKKSEGRISAPSPVSTANDSVLFSLKRCINSKYCFSALNADQKAAFAEALFTRRSLTWNEFQQANRHGLGTEKIGKSSISVPVPANVTEEVETLLAVRFDGKAPMVGYRIGAVFYILWFDHDFSLYDHG